MLTLFIQVPTSAIYGDQEEESCDTTISNYHDLYKTATQVYIAKYSNSKPIRLIEVIKGKSPGSEAHFYNRRNQYDQRIYFLVFDNTGSCVDESMTYAQPLAYKKGIGRQIKRHFETGNSSSNLSKFTLAQSTLVNYAKERAKRLKQANLLYKQKKYAAVVKLLRTNIFVLDDDIKRSARLANSYRRLGKHAQALATIDGFFSRAPHPEYKLSFNGACYASLLGKQKRAWEHLQRIPWEELPKEPHFEKLRRSIFSDPDLNKFRKSRYFSMMKKKLALQRKRQKEQALKMQRLNRLLDPSKRRRRKRRR